jgi:aminopeptidase N
MLRMLMRSGAKDPDDAFLKMVREFLGTYNGRTASTWDLKRVAEKYMTKAMDVRGDRKLDWFFDDWVMGTGIPSFSVNYRIQPSARGGFVVEGRITQTGVPDTFIMPVPLYGDDQLLGTVVVSDDEGNFRFETKSKPTRVTVDPQQTILSLRSSASPR